MVGSADLGDSGKALCIGRERSLQSLGHHLSRSFNIFQEFSKVFITFDEPLMTLRAKDGASGVHLLLCSKDPWHK